MKRREFSVAAAVSVASLSVGAQVLQPKADVDYLVLSTRAPVDAPAGKVEVVDFFWYDCPHCNAFEPVLQSWINRQAPEVAVRRVPVGFRDSFVPLQRLFYALEGMNQVDALHAKVFAAIHGPTPELPKEARGEQIAAWVEKQGVDVNRFVTLFNAPETVDKVRKASRLQNQYKVSGVPALGVDGRFYTDGDMAKSLRRSLQVVDYLVAEVRAGR